MTPDSFESVSNMTVLQHPDVRVSEAYIAILVLSMSIESIPSNQGPQHACHYRPHWTNQLKNYIIIYVVSPYKGV